VQESLDRTGGPGAAVAVVHDGQMVYSNGFGVREVGKGTVAWDDPVTKYLPGFALSDPRVTDNATIADFYSHRSGLPAAAGDQLEDMGYGRDYVLAQMRQLALDPFRITYHYTNFGMTVGGEAVAKAAGVPWEQLSARALYEPLGMTSTTSDYEKFLDEPNRAVVHRREDSTWVPSSRDATAQDPAGGVNSSVTDLAKWMQLQLDNGMPLGVPETINAQFMDIVQTGGVTRDWATAYTGVFEKPSVNPSELEGKTPPANAPQRPNATYVGVYTNPYFGSATVIEVDGKLKLRLGPTPMEFDLTHFDGETFSFTPPGENSLGPTAITFTVAGSGSATSFLSEYYSTDGFGNWVKAPGTPSTAPVPPNDNSL